MPAVTQRVDNYLGGVSRQADSKKLPGQVEECLIGYPDPTFGLTKRPGFQWIANLATGTTYDNSKWFFIPCLLYTSPSPRDRTRSRMPSSA